jgi:hypothetical protein
VGLALDEPREGDRREVQDGVEFVMAERDASLLLGSGPLSLGYSERGWSRGYRVLPGRACGC